MPDSGSLSSVPSKILDYVERGFSIIPINRGEKTPAIRWKEYQERGATEAEVKQWAQAHPGCNWGIVTGPASGVVVLDFDSQEAYDRAKKGLPPGPRVKTPRGLHCYFKYPSKRVGSYTNVFPDCDIRGDGGVAVAPPSELENGQHYTWEVPLGEGEPPRLPNWVFRAVERRPERLDQATLEAPPLPADPKGSTLRALATELAGLAGAPEGSRNTRLNRSAFILGQYIGCGTLDRELTEEALRAVAARIGLREGEISATLKSGIEAGIQEPLWERSSRFRLLSAADLRELPDPSWLVEEILPLGGLAVIYGAPGVGKSFVALDWACCAASGKSWLDDRAVTEGSVIYVCAEGATGYKHRVAAWELKYGSLTDKPIRFLTVPLDVPNAEHVDDLIGAIQSTDIPDPKLVVIDIVARCFGGGDENTAKDMNGFIQGADHLRNSLGNPTVLLVHHSGKDGERGARGSTALSGACDTEMELTKGHVLKCKKQKDAEPFTEIHLALQPVSLAGTLDAPTSCIVRRGTANGETSGDAAFRINPSDQRALEVLAEHRTTGLSWSDWLAETGLSKSTFSRCRERLKEHGHVAQDGALYRISDRSQGSSTPEQGT